MVWSSESAPTLIFGGTPVISPRFFKALYVKSLRASGPVQSGRLSCSMENETKVRERGWALIGE